MESFGYLKRALHGEICLSAGALLEGKRADFVIADKAYDSDKTLEKIAEMEATVVIPPKSNRKDERDYDKRYYKDRNLIEPIFLQIKTISRYCYSLLQTRQIFLRSCQVGLINYINVLIF